MYFIDKNTTTKKTRTERSAASRRAAAASRGNSGAQRVGVSPRGGERSNGEVGEKATALCCCCDVIFFFFLSFFSREAEAFVLINLFFQ